MFIPQKYTKEEIRVDAIQQEIDLAFFKQSLKDHNLPEDASENDLFAADFIESQQENNRPRPVKSHIKPLWSREE